MLAPVLALLACLLPASAWVTPAVPQRAVSASVARSSAPAMGPAKDGPFTPAVLAAKVVLGEQNLLKIRGKAIGIHSQVYLSR